MSDNFENEDIEENEQPLTKPKIKRQRTEAQIKAFEKVQERRRANIEAKKQEKLLNSAKLLMEQEQKKKASKEEVSYKPQRCTFEKSTAKKDRGVSMGHSPNGRMNNVEQDDEHDENESEEEIIIKKAKKKDNLKKNIPKKKVRKIIIEESESESDDDSESEDERPRHKNNRQLQVIREQPKQMDYRNFFV